MNDIMKIIKCLQDYVYLQKVLAKQLKVNQMNKKADFSVCYNVHYFLVY